MSERPWLEVKDPSLRLERELLKRLNAEQPPTGSVEQGWSALSAEIAGMQALSAAGSGSANAAHGATHAAQAASSGVGLGLAAKIVAGAALAGGVLWGGNQLLGSDDAALRPQESNRPAQVARPPTTVEASLPSSDFTTPEPVSSKAQPPANPARPATSTTLAEEGRMLAKARQLLQAGQGQRALQVLRSSESRYPRSVLFQEREVLSIEALGATGATGAARQRAERFLKRYPNSAHAGRLQRFVE